MSVHWVPRELNQAADDASKLSDGDDWILNPAVFRELDARWGPHACDRFASDKKHLCPVFYSQFFRPGSAGVDSFAFSWHNANNWINPLFNLIGRVLRKL